MNQRTLSRRLRAAGIMLAAIALLPLFAQANIDTRVPKKPAAAATPAPTAGGMRAVERRATAPAAAPKRIEVQRDDHESGPSPVESCGCTGA